MKTKTNILLVEDEENLGSTLKEYLQSLDYDVHWAKSGQEASSLFSQHSPQIVLLDIGLPDTDGVTLASKLKEIRQDFIFLFLSAWNDPEIKVKGLELGAEDYITKPFALKELLLRLEKIKGRLSSLSLHPEEITHGPLKIWFKRFQLQDAKGKIHSMTQKECSILQLLYKEKNKAVTRTEIIDQVWGNDAYPSNRTVDNYIVNLRKWCDTDTKGNIEIQSIRGVGYKLILKE